MSEDRTSRLAAAKRAVAAELNKQGTPDYDPRSHERLVEAERKAAEESRPGAAEH
ncbi:MAG: translation initiation factor 2 [Actinobacteria bacterium]|nr:translation initiation factor 2 [Actinomycetota bacterium]MCG2800969.1 translation initiation factor 2 [Cellulomonas sp.]